MSELEKNSLIMSVKNLGTGNDTGNEQIQTGQVNQDQRAIEDFKAPGFAQWSPFFPNLSSSAQGLNTNIQFLSKKERLLYPVQTGTSPTEAMYAIMLTYSNELDTTGLATDLRTTMLQMIQLTNGLYRGVLEKCKDIISKIDLDDADEKHDAVNSLANILFPFNSVLSPIFSGLLEWRKNEPVAISFLLIEVLPNIDGVRIETRLAIIRTVLEEARASVRFAAIQALDNFGIAAAQQILAEIYPQESSKLARDLISNSLSEA